ncbi:isoprenylcysteine carboxylmethyltransferase family protein [Aeromicrobium sp. 9AM]|uniref:methyltransferase family protein n=1 Tax=Aeromicrobium sp. 9AM TaxID=2653126 RepID=UPI0012F0CEF3|nr:isoprenylcysteine carboxylmethyltransferase family protein [Aeromicrobium sp. 9AM]VXB18415.1 Isoprenylcysteine carboxyl methyltransferase [Aeromicrobium sp. 9AM]
MRRATLGTTAFFFAAPGTVAGLVPWLLTHWDRPAGGLRVADVLGGGLVAIGLAVVIAAFAQFVREGRGTPAPIAPTEQLVVGGLYRYVRNPMYLAVAAVIGGQALIFESSAVLVWLLGFMVLVLAFVTAYEQPTLRRTYGAGYEAYCDAVPGWWPRLTPWRG